MEKEHLNNKLKLLLIGGSAGALNVLLQIIPNLKKDLSFPVVIILHRKADAESTLEYLLDMVASLPVKEIEDKEKMMAGKIYLVPADYHLLIEKNGLFSLDASEKIHYCRPAIDVTFESAAAAFPGALAALILSGANGDGTIGAKAVKASGGIVWVQSPESASIDYMPQYVIKHTEVDQILKIEEMAKAINDLL